MIRYHRSLNHVSATETLLSIPNCYTTTKLSHIALSCLKTETMPARDWWGLVTSPSAPYEKSQAFGFRGEYGRKSET